jgi:hypothetical protein
MYQKILSLALILVTAFTFVNLVNTNHVYAACDTSATGTGVDCVKDAINAANDGNSSTILINTSFGFKTLNQALNTIVSIIFLVAGLLAFLFILLGAFNYLTAGDDDGKVKKARTGITNAVIGLLLVALVYVLWQVAIHLIPGMGDLFGVS